MELIFMKQRTKTWLPLIGFLGGVYFGWTHANELITIGNKLGEDTPFYVGLTTKIPLISKCTCAYLEGKVIGNIGTIVSNGVTMVLERIVQDKTVTTKNTRYLNSKFRNCSIDYTLCENDIERGTIEHMFYKSEKRNADAERFVAIPEIELTNLYGSKIVDSLKERGRLVSERKHCGFLEVLSLDSSTLLKNQECKR